MIKRRLVFLFPGFEPMSAKAHRDRFQRSAGRSAPFFDCDLETRQGPSVAAPGGHSFLTLNAELRAGDATTQTRVVFCDWGDLIARYGERPALRRFLSGLGALADFFATGTFFRYCRVSWRYGLFFSFPMAVVVVSLLAGLLADGLAGHLLAGLPALLLEILVFAGVVAAIVGYACRRMYLLTALDDWTMARDFCRGRNEAITARIAEQAAIIAAEGGATEADEIVVAAHSLGTSLAVLALAGAMDRGFRPGRRLSILTVGSSLMKTALHPAGSAQREAVRRFVVEERLAWTDYQALSDPINFYKSNPATSLGIVEGRIPTVRKVHFKRLVSPATYRRIRRDFFRLHRQFVLAVERRAPYSFHMLLLGATPLGDGLGKPPDEDTGAGKIRPEPVSPRREAAE